MPTPEQLARQNIDALLAQCGWMVQSRAEMNLGAARGIAVLPLLPGDNSRPFSSGQQTIDRVSLTASLS